MTLPRDAYTSADWFASEQAEFFAKTWIFAGVASSSPRDNAAGGQREHRKKFNLSLPPMDLHSGRSL